MVDVLVVGAGPGGSAAAIEATRRGLTALVVDKAHFPRDKCCGDGLTTAALRRLDDLGIDPTSIPSWQEVDEVCVRAPSGRQRRFPLPSDGSFAAVARRSELDAALVARAEEAGAEVRQGHELVGLDIDSGEVVGPAGDAPVRARLAGNRNGPASDGPASDGPASDGNTPVEVVARHLVAADGMWSPTRKLLGLTPQGYRGEWHAFRQYFTGVTGRAAEDLLVWFEPDLLPGYAWSFPVAGGVANVGFGILREPGRSVQAMKGQWTDLLARDHIVDALGSGARPEAPHRAWPIPTRLGRVPMAAGPVLFVGDALAAGDPMTGEGIGQAIETGQAAATAIATHLGRPDAAAARYRSELERGMARDHRLAARLGRVLTSPGRADAAVRAAGATDWTRRNFARWLFEAYPRAALVNPRRWHRDLFTAPGAYR